MQEMVCYLFGVHRLSQLRLTLYIYSDDSFGVHIETDSMIYMHCHLSDLIDYGERK